MEIKDLAKFVLEEIEEQRKNRGWSIYRLADLSGINSQTIHYWYKHNVIPSLQFIHDICMAFGITLSDFFADTNKDN